jgi:hypothetical protein
MPKILISYRRNDSSAFTGRIHDKLVSYYGDTDVFMDVEDIPPGVDYRAHIRDRILAAKMVLAVIGPSWLGRSADGSARLAADEDPVRVEIEIALDAGKHVVPLLIDGAGMPNPAEVPEKLRPFCFLNAVRIGGAGDFHPHMTQLVERLESPGTSRDWLRRRKPAAWLSNHKPQTLVMAVGFVLLAAAGVFRDRIANVLNPTASAVFLLPPKGYDRDTKLFETELFRNLWAAFYDAFPNGSNLRQIPNGEEFDQEDFIRRFSSPSMQARREAAIKYASLVGSRIDWLVLPSISTEGQGARVTVRLENGDREVLSEISKLGPLSYGGFLAMAAGYEVVRKVISSRPPNTRDTPEQLIERVAAEGFDNVLESLKTVNPAVELEKFSRTSTGLDDLIRAVSEVASHQLKQDATRDLVSTAAEKARLDGGSAQQ